MSTRIAALPALALVAATCVGCAAVGHRGEARDLRDELRAEDGVRRVKVTYNDPELFDSADVYLHVRMDEGATSAEVASVVETAYAGLIDVHLGEEGNLTVQIDDDTVYLRTFESEADPVDVEAAAFAAATVAEQWHRAYVEVMAQDIEEAPHVRSTVWLHLPKAAEGDEADRARAAVEDVYGDLDVTVDIRIGRR